MRAFVIAFVSYAALAKLGLAMAFVNASASPVWAPSGVGLAAFLLAGPRLWPAVFAAAFLVNWHTTGVAWTSALIAAGNTGEGLLAAFLVRRWSRTGEPFDQPEGVTSFTLAAMLAPVLSATVGVTTLAAAGLAGWETYPRVWLTWWLGDAAGALLVAPLIALWARGAPPRRSALGELAGVSAAAGALAWFAVQQHGRPFLFLLLPPVLWTAYRHGPRHGLTVAAAITVCASAAVLAGASPDPNESLLMLQSFVAVLAVLALSVGAASAARRREEEARKSFFAALSHDLRTPIAAIKGFSEALLLGALENKDDRVEFVRTIERHADRLTALADGLLRMAVLEVRGQAPKGTAVARFVLDEAVAGLRPLWRARQLDVQVAAGSDVVVAADEGELLQVIQNLLDNAIKFNKPGGRVRLGARTEGRKALIWVEDTGIGIADEEREQLFAPLARSVRAQSVRGTGLGLYVARRLAESHGGRLTAERVPSGGARFTLELPLAH